MRKNLHPIAFQNQGIGGKEPYNWESALSGSVITKFHFTSGANTSM